MPPHDWDRVCGPVIDLTCCRSPVVDLIAQTELEVVQPLKIEKAPPVPAEGEDLVRSDHVTERARPTGP